MLATHLNHEAASGTKLLTPTTGQPVEMEWKSNFRHCGEVLRLSDGGPCDVPPSSRGRMNGPEGRAPLRHQARPRWPLLRRSPPFRPARSGSRRWPLFLQHLVQQTCGIWQAQLRRPGFERAIAGDLAILDRLRVGQQARIKGGATLELDNEILPLGDDALMVSQVLPIASNTSVWRFDWACVSCSWVSKAALRSRFCAARALLLSAVAILRSG